MYCSSHYFLFHHTPRRRLCGEEVQLLFILNICTRWWDLSASRPGRALTLWEGPLVPTVQDAGWASEPVWTQRLQEKSFRLCRGSNLDRPVVQPVARHYTAWATRLGYQCKKLKLVESLSALIQAMLMNILIMSTFISFSWRKFS
jgi:hypothetical protein